MHNGSSCTPDEEDVCVKTAPIHQGTARTWLSFEKARWSATSTGKAMSMLDAR
jgi:hypothetical protein